MSPNVFRNTGFALVVVLISSSCTLRYAQSSFAEPLLDGARSGVAIEGGGYFWEGRLAGQRGDIGIMGSYQKFDFFTDAAATHLEARARWFAVPDGPFQPFLGGGLGVYRLSRTGSDARCRGSSICLTAFNDQRGQATGLTPHLAAGVEVVPSGSPVAVVVGVTREFGVFDPEWDLTAWRFAAGLTVRPSR